MILGLNLPVPTSGRDEQNYLRDLLGFDGFLDQMWRCRDPIAGTDAAKSKGVYPFVRLVDKASNVTKLKKAKAPDR